MAIQVANVVFTRTLGGMEKILPLAEAWAFFEQVQRIGESWEIHQVIVTDGETAWRCFAKAWSAWFPDEKIWKLMRIGTGASGDGGPKNPGV